MERHGEMFLGSRAEGCGWETSAELDLWTGGRCPESGGTDGAVDGALDGVDLTRMNTGRPLE